MPIAITDPRVLDTIGQGANGVIAVAYIEWAGSFSTDLVVDWRVIHDASSAQILRQGIVERAPGARRASTRSAPAWRWPRG